MEALFEIIGQIISFVNLQINDALKADIKHRVFLKEGEIQNAITNNTQAQYSNLESQISEAAVLQYQEQLQDETKRKVITGNLISIIVSIVVIIIVVILMFWISKKNNK